MSYLINRFSGSELVVLEDGTVDVSTDLSLVGRNTVGYGEIQNENFIFLLENFSNPNPPNRPISGQLWHASNDNTVNVYNGTEWLNVGSATFSGTAPTAQTGGFWIRTTDNTLHFYNGIEWTFVGPETSEGFDTTRLSSSTLIDTDGVTRPVILLKVNGVTYGILTDQEFFIDQINSVEGFFSLQKGLNLRNEFGITGNLNGIAQRASVLENARTINGIPFNGSQNINISASTEQSHIRGDYLIGSNFDGSTEVRWDVEASPLNRAGKIVARDIQGNFAAGTISADLVGNVTGNVTATSGTSSFSRVEAAEFIGATLSGNAFSASKLQTGRRINSVFFDGTSDITISADAKTLTNNELSPSVVASSLERLGTLENLNVADRGINIGAGQMVIGSTESPTLNAVSRFDIRVDDSNFLTFINGSTSLSLGGDNTDTVFGTGVNLGHPNNKFDKVYANTFIGDLTGNASTSDASATSTNLSGGGIGALPYQSSLGNTTFLAPGAPGQLLKLNGAGIPFWDDIAFGILSPGQYINGVDYNGNNTITWNIDATDFNSGNKIVARDASGNFSAGTITADLNGVASEIFVNESSDDNNNYNIVLLNTTETGGGGRELQVDSGGLQFNPSNNTISGVNLILNGRATDNVLSAGDVMTGALTLSGDPTSNLQAATKQYVDTSINTAFATNVFGANYRWVRRKNQRDVFTDYTNTTGNLIWVAATVDGRSYSSYAIATVDGIEVGRDRDNGSAAAPVVYLNLGFFVPAGSTYRIEVYSRADAQVTNAPTTAWAEFEPIS